MIITKFRFRLGYIQFTIYTGTCEGFVEFVSIGSQALMD